MKVACFLLQKGLFIVGKLPLYAAHSTGNLHMGSADKLQAPAKRLPLQRELSAFRLTEDILFAGAVLCCMLPNAQCPYRCFYPVPTQPHLMIFGREREGGSSGTEADSLASPPKEGGLYV